MSLDASKFKAGRKTNMALTFNRVRVILGCVIRSYEKIIADGVVFDYARCGKMKKEDFLRNRLVDDYLSQELSRINSGTDRFSIANKETSEEYIGDDDELHNDPMDIQIIDSALTNTLEDINSFYFAIECKRLISTVSEYHEDIKKFTQRKYIKNRLPIEGQLGFIEKRTWNHSSVSDLVNKCLNTSAVETIQKLKPEVIKVGFNGSYISKHRKINKDEFSIYHLFFDYYDIVKNS